MFPLSQSVTKMYQSKSARKYTSPAHSDSLLRWPVLPQSSSATIRSPGVDQVWFLKSENGIRQKIRDMSYSDRRECREMLEPFIKKEDDAATLLVTLAGMTFLTIFASPFAGLMLGGPFAIRGKARQINKILDEF
jgi:hypothetical protein